jgi:streptogramin lyase
LLSSSGAPLSGAAGYAAGAFPVALAVDANHNAWIGDQTDANVTRVSSDGTQIVKFACCNEPNGLAVDSSGNVWVANFGGDSITELSSAGTVLLNGITGGGLKHPQGVAVDGAGTVWVANYRGPSLSQLAGASSSSPGQVLSPAAGWGPEAALLEAYAIAIDASGNLWVSNFATNSITEFVGMAAPVKTPVIGPSQKP